MRAALYEVPVKSLAFAGQLAAGLQAELDCLTVEVVDINPCAAGLSAAESREAARLVLAGFVATVRSWHHVEPHEGYADVARRGLRLVELPDHLRGGVGPAGSHKPGAVRSSRTPATILRGAA